MLLVDCLKLNQLANKARVIFYMPSLFDQHNPAQGTAQFQWNASKSMLPTILCFLS